MKNYRDMAESALQRAAGIRADAAAKRRRILAVGTPVCGACLMLLLGFGVWRFAKTPSRVPLSGTPTVAETAAPTETPTAQPTVIPTVTPTDEPIAAPSAEPTDIRDGLFTYRLNPNGTFTITYVEPHALAELKLPEVYQGIPVTAVGDNAFWCYSLENDSWEGRYELKTVVIPEGVTDIGYRSFLWCINLESIVIPSTVQHIEAGAFQNCFALQDAVVPEGVTVLKDYAFYGCRSMTHISLPSTLTEIGFRAFANCLVLKDIDFAGTVEQWNRISKGTYWEEGSAWFTVHCADGDVYRPTKQGKEGNIAYFAQAFYNFASEPYETFVVEDINDGNPMNSRCWQNWIEGDDIGLLFDRPHTIDRIQLHTQFFRSPEEGAYTVCVLTEDGEWLPLAFSCTRSTYRFYDYENAEVYTLDELIFDPVEKVCGVKLVFGNCDYLDEKHYATIEEFEVYEVN